MNTHKRLQNIDKLQTQLLQIKTSDELMTYQIIHDDIVAVVNELQLPTNIHKYLLAQIADYLDTFFLQENRQAVIKQTISIIQNAVFIAKNVDEMNIMIDDDLINRQTPENYIRYTNLEDFVKVLDHIYGSITIDTILLDNDLGDGHMEGHKLMNIMVMHHPDVEVNWLNMHSENTVAVKRVASAIDSQRRHHAWAPAQFTTYKLNDLYFPS